MNLIANFGVLGKQFKKLAVKHPIEIPILLNFVNLSTTQLAITFSKLTIETLRTRCEIFSKSTIKTPV